MKCTRCEVEKVESEFSKRSRKCKKCCVLIAKEWKLKNPDKVRASERKCRELRKDELRDYHAKWREDNRDRYNATQTRYREANRETCKKRCLDQYHRNPWKNREWREDNRNKCKEYSKSYRERNLEEIRKKRRDSQKEKRIHETLEGKARKAVYMAIKRGELQRSVFCEMCNLECKTQAHHRDYTLPLEVLWVCSSCHGLIHMKMNRNKQCQR